MPALYIVSSIDCASFVVVIIVVVVVILIIVVTTTATTDVRYIPGPWLTRCAAGEFGARGDPRAHRDPVQGTWVVWCVVTMGSMDMRFNTRSRCSRSTLGRTQFAWPRPGPARRWVSGWLVWLHG